MKNRVITVLLILCLILCLTACNKSKNDEESTTVAPLSYTVKAADGASYTVTEGKDKSGKQVYNISGGTILSVIGDRRAFLAQKLVSFADLNFDGNLDLVFVKSGYDTEGKMPKLAVYLFDAETKKFNLTKADICDYELVPDSKLIVVKQSKFVSAGKDAVCSFDEFSNLNTIRSLDFGINSDKKYFLKVIDYSSEGTFLLFNSATKKEDYEKIPKEDLLLLGLDGKTVAISTAEDAVHRVAGSKNSGVSVDCEGVFQKDGVWYYRMRVDKADITSGYYGVNSQSGEVVLLKSGSQLI